MVENKLSQPGLLEVRINLLLVQKCIVFIPSYMASTLFLSTNVLQKSQGIDDTGPFVWQLFLALTFSWLLVYFIVFKGIKVKLVVINIFMYSL
jgi:hypothetical protein